MISLSRKVKELVHSPTLEVNNQVAERRAKGEPVLHMGFGESPFPVPERLQKSLATAAHRKDYTAAAGVPEVRETVREYYRPLVGDVVDDMDVLIAPGSKLILYALQAVIEGDLLLAIPSWVSYGPQAKLLGTEVIRVPTTSGAEDYQIDPQILRECIKDARSKGLSPAKIILNFPNNPTGLRMGHDNLEALIKVCDEESIFVISDEIYGQVAFDEEYFSMASFGVGSVAISTGLSKHLSLGGWRFGVGFIPKNVPGLFEALCSFISETWSCVSTPIQIAAQDAYRKFPDIEAHIADCTRIHQLMNTYICEGLRGLGVHCPEPTGAFYNYPDFEAFRTDFARHNIMTSQDLCEVLMSEYHLASLSEAGFDGLATRLTLRLSGVDYDGAAALEAYQGGEPLNEGFVHKYAPNLKLQIETFQMLLAKVKN